MTSSTSEESSVLHRHLQWEIPLNGYDHEQFIYKDYTSETEFGCSLCRISFEEHLRSSHCNSKDHKTGVDRMMDGWMRQYPYSVGRSSTSIKPRIDALGLESWREQLQGLLYVFILSGIDPGMYPCVDQWLEVFEQRERTSLLELAVWKAACIACADSAAMKDYHSWLKWFKDGWKSQKCTLRHANEIVIILTHVVPFLPTCPKPKRSADY